MTKTGRRLLGKAIDDALDPAFEVDFAEVDQQPQTPLAQAELRQHLFAGIVLGNLLCVLGALCVRCSSKT